MKKLSLVVMVLGLGLILNSNSMGDEVMGLLVLPGRPPNIMSWGGRRIQDDNELNKFIATFNQKTSGNGVNYLPLTPDIIIKEFLEALETALLEYPLLEYPWLLKLDEDGNFVSLIDGSGNKFTFIKSTPVDEKGDPIGNETPVLEKTPSSLPEGYDKFKGSAVGKTIRGTANLEYKDGLVVCERRKGMEFGTDENGKRYEKDFETTTRTTYNRLGLPSVIHTLYKSGQEIETRQTYITDRHRDGKAKEQTIHEWGADRTYRIIEMWDMRYDPRTGELVSYEFKIVEEAKA